MALIIEEIVNGAVGRENLPAITALYLKRPSAFHDLTKRAERISRGSGGIYVEGNRLSYASVLFTRLCIMAKSIEVVLPYCKPKAHWDFSSVASLTRNLIEAYFWYFWLCEDEVDDDTRQGRFTLLYCHDNGTRAKLWGRGQLQPETDVVMADLIKRFDENPYLRTFSESKRKESLKGEKTPFIQDEILERMGTADKTSFRSMYRFFSEHTHTGPLSFFRMIEHDRGTGVETEHEKRYMIIALMFASAFLSHAIEGHLKLFPDAETRKVYLTTGEISKNVERSQGRVKRK